ncbi:MAG: VWA domain-containing protein, partial [Acidimicrobiales bacterium]
MKRLLAAALLAALALLLAAPPAPAADAIVIRKLDLSAYPTVTISALVAGETPDPRNFSLRENGRILTQFEVIPIGQTDTAIGIVLVIDVSGSMRTGNKLAAAKDAAKQFVAQKLPNDQVAVVAFSNQAQVVSNFTNDGARLTQVIDGLVATGETALFDGVRTAATLFNDRPDLQANIVVLSDGADTVSQNGVAEAESSVLSAKAALFAVGLRGGEFDAASLNRLASASGGQYTETTDTQALRSLYANVQRALQNQYEINYTSTATEGTVEISLAAEGARATAGPVKAGSGAVAEGATARPEAADKSRFSGSFGGTAGLVLIAVAAFLAAALLVLGLNAMFGRETPALAETLSQYDVESASERRARRRRGGADMDLAQTAVLRRAVEATAKIARERGLLQVVEYKLEKADLPVRPAEALFFYAVGVLVFFLVGLLLQGAFGGLIALLVFGLTPVAILDYMGAQRQRRFTAQLPDMLQLLASTLRAGYSLLQGADAVSEQVDDPMGKELRRVLVEARLGRPLEQAFEDSARRVKSKDYEWAVMAIRIQREVGGNLAELLQT